MLHSWYKTSASNCCTTLRTTDVSPITLVMSYVSQNVPRNRDNLWMCFNQGHVIPSSHIFQRCLKPILDAYLCSCLWLWSNLWWKRLLLGGHICSSSSLPFLRNSQTWRRGLLENFYDFTPPTFSAPPPNSPYFKRRGLLCGESVGERPQLLSLPHKGWAELYMCMCTSVSCVYVWVYVCFATMTVTMINDILNKSSL